MPPSPHLAPPPPRGPPPPPSPQNRSYQFYKPPRIDDDAVRSAWNPRRSPAQNLAAMGLRSAVNAALDGRAAQALAGSAPDGEDAAPRKAVELFDVPDSDDARGRGGVTVVPGKTYAMRKLPVSVDDQKYIARCLARHGDDYQAMARDIKTNDMQHTAARLRKMAARFYLLAKEHLRVDVPERARHLMACCRDDGGEGGAEKGGA